MKNLIRVGLASVFLLGTTPSNQHKISPLEKEIHETYRYNITSTKGSVSFGEAKWEVLSTQRHTRSQVHVDLAWYIELFQAGKYAVDATTRFDQSWDGGHLDQYTFATGKTLTTWKRSTAIDPLSFATSLIYSKELPKTTIAPVFFNGYEALIRFEEVARNSARGIYKVSSVKGSKVDLSKYTMRFQLAQGYPHFVEEASIRGPKVDLKITRKK